MGISGSPLGEGHSDRFTEVIGGKLPWKLRREFPRVPQVGAPKRVAGGKEIWVRPRGDKLRVGKGSSVLNTGHDTMCTVMCTRAILVHANTALGFTSSRPKSIQLLSP